MSRNVVSKVYPLISVQIDRNFCMDLEDIHHGYSYLSYKLSMLYDRCDYHPLGSSSNDYRLIEEILSYMEFLDSTMERFLDVNRQISFQSISCADMFAEFAEGKVAN